MTRGRPGAALVSAVVFGAAALVTDAPRFYWFLAVLAVGVVTTQLPAFIALRRGVPVERVARAVLLSDIPMVAGLTAALDSENLLAVAFFAPLAFAALMFGARFTLLLAGLAAVAVIVVGVVFVEAGTLTIVADLVVLGVTGAILAGLSKEVRTAEAALARERASDAAALRVAERVRASLDLDNVLRHAVEELGSAVDASRCVIRVAPRDDEWRPMYEWTRADTPSLEHPEPPPVLREIFQTRRDVIVDDAAEIRDEGLRTFLDEIGARSFISLPVVWQEQTVALIGFHDDRPRRWSDDALPLLERVVPQLAAALAQAQLYEQQQATLDQFRELSRLREELVANVSHELRTPLTSTLGFLQTLQRRRGQLDDAQQEHFIGLALREAERLARLVDDLLDLARLERGVLALSMGPVDLRQTIERASLGLDVDGRQLRVDLGDHMVARGDGDRLLQVFSNLLGNAAKHGEGEITVTGELSARHVSIAISDGGGGIPSERISELFVPFSRWGTRGDSTGLGLAISRGIVHAHGGTLFYRPAGEGAEHAFVVTLPRDDVTFVPLAPSK